jgi:hypothetical protein
MWPSLLDFRGASLCELEEPILKRETRMDFLPEEWGENLVVSVLECSSARS